MPSLDMESAPNASTDYGDFRYQNVSVRHSNDMSDNTDATNVNSTAEVEVEPLAGRGGLDTNEVAELVYLEVLTNIEYEQEAADQDVGSASEFRGTVGINLPSTDAALVDNVGTEIGTAQIIDQSVGGDYPGVDANVTTDDRFLQVFSVQGAPAFDDDTGGTGGSGFTSQFHSEKYYRELTGRGPVLDSNDTIDTVSRMISADSLIGEIGNIYLSMFWDVAEVDEAGRAFSVPRM